MAWYVGDIISESFFTGVPGESFSRAASYIDNAAITWNPTFVDLGGGAYRYTYTAAATGIHEWIGSGSTTGPLAINFDVAEAESNPASVTLLRHPFAINVKDFGAKGDGTTDDTAAIQAAIAAASAANGVLSIPPTLTGYRVTNTLLISSSSGGSYVFMDIVAAGKNGLITWAGSDNKPVFRCRNWKQSFVQGVEIQIPATSKNVVSWSHESDDTYQSNTSIMFRDCAVRFADGAQGCTGWQAENNGGAGDFASFAWESCIVYGAGSTYLTDGNIGWRSQAPNALAWTWKDCVAANLAVGWVNQKLATLQNGAIDASVTTITVDETGFLPPSGKVVIGTERVSYSSRTATQLLGCARGVDGTTAASHSDNSVVFEYRVGGTSGGNWVLLNPNIDSIGTVFSIANGPLAVFGGRAESVERLIQAGQGAETTIQRVSLTGFSCAMDVAPKGGVLVRLGTATHLTFRGCNFYGSDAPAGLITATGGAAVEGFGAAGPYGSVTLTDCDIRAAVGVKTFWSLPATWSVFVTESTRMNSSSVPQETIGTGPRVSADNGDATATLIAGANEMTQLWATPLTADRTAGLAVTDAYPGARFRIVRTMAATGAFNLNVGTGPLKALATGQWCDVEYSGSAWVLTAYGEL